MVVIEIIVDPNPTNSRRYLLSESLITGEVVVETGSDKTNYNKIELVFVGRIDSDFTDRDNGLRCTYEQEIIRSSVTLWEKTETDPKFPKGVTRLSFAMDILSDPNILPSCENDRTKVQYKLNVIVTKEKKLKKVDLVGSTIVKIFPKVNIGSRELQGYQSYQRDISVTGHWLRCISPGSVEIDVRFQKAYALGEVAELEVAISNETGKVINYFDVALMRNIECGGIAKKNRGKKNRRRSMSLKFTDVTHIIGERVVGRSVLPRSNWSERLYVQIPTVSPPTFEEDGGAILSVMYYFYLRVHVSRHSSKPLEMKCPVVIGTSNHSPDEDKLYEVEQEKPPPFANDELEETDQFPSASAPLIELEDDEKGSSPENPPESS